MNKQQIQSNLAPLAIGPYSQAIAASNLIFVSGQIPLDPQTGVIVGNTAAQQAEQVLTNLSAILEAAGSSLSDVIKTTIMLADINDFASVNDVYGRHFKDGVFPARSTFAVAALPKGALVEIEAIALRQ